MTRILRKPLQPGFLNICILTVKIQNQLLFLLTRSKFRKRFNRAKFFVLHFNQANANATQDIHLSARWIGRPRSGAQDNA